MSFVVHIDDELLVWFTESTSFRFGLQSLHESVLVDDKKKRKIKIFISR